MSRLKFRRPSWSLVIAVMALIVAVGGGTNAYAAATNFLLNTSNTSSSATTLDGSAVAGKALQITNTNTGVGATALGLNVATGHAPFTVNSATKVAKLNADKLDGLDSTQLQQRITGACSVGGAVQSIDATGGVVCAGLATRAIVQSNGGFPKADQLSSIQTRGGLLLVSFSVSGYNASADRLLSAQLRACPTTPCGLNTPGSIFLANAYVYTNEANSHKLMDGPLQLKLLPAGTWYLNVFPASGTITDQVDLANVGIIEFGS